MGVRRLVGHRHRQGAGEVLAGGRLLHALHLRGRALGDDPPAVFARAGAEVDEVVGGAHRLLVVLDHDHRVAEIAQPLQRGDQLRVVTLVQPDRGLVEDVQHADQRAADLRGQADPLRLPAGERGGGAVHREVADADVLQELQPLGDLAQDQPRHVAVGVGELHLIEPLDRAPRGERAEVLDPRAPHQHRPGLRAQPRAPAHRAGPQRHVLLQFLLHPLGLGFAVALFEVGDQPGEAGGVGAPATEAVAVGDRQRLLRSLQEQVVVLQRKVLPRRVEVDAVALGER